MAASRRQLHLGCVVTVPATIFDEPNNERWSVAVFGSEANSKALECTVVSMRRGRVKVRVHHDGDRYEFAHAVITHNPASCPKCRSNATPQHLPSLSQRAQAPRTGPDIGGTYFPNGGSADAPGTGVPANRTDSDDDDTPLDCLARAATGLNLMLDTEEPPSQATDVPVAQRRAKRKRQPVVEAEMEVSEGDTTILGSSDSEARSDEEENLADGDEDFEGSYNEGESPQSRGSGRLGRGRGRGRGRCTGGRQSARSPPHEDTQERVKRHRLWWTKNATRTVDPLRTGGGFTGRPVFKLHNYRDASPLQYFEAVFPSCVPEIAAATTLAGKAIVRPSFDCSEADMWLFLGLKHYIMIFNQDGDKSQYWETSGDGQPGVFVVHDLGKYGMTYSRFRDIERAFCLPTYGNPEDVFNPIRFFADQWNDNMKGVFEPSWVLVVDESMGKWLGKGMPGLMVVPRKPTPCGREAHTTACGETCVILFYEMYEGKERMEAKEFVEVAGKAPAKAMRCVKNWFSTGRVVILDAGFASVKCAEVLTDKGLFMIGNVKGASAKFPKDWLLGQVNKRGDRATATAESITPDGNTCHMLASIDVDKQPMALLGTAGSSTPGETLHRKFTTIRADGTYNIREATLEQDHIHAVYRKYFNALDKHNSVRQGGISWEDTWRTHRWWVREFQMLFGMSEVNAWLLYKRYKPTQQGHVSFSNFRRELCKQLLLHPKIMRDRELRARGGEAVCSGHCLINLGTAPGGHSIQKACVFCGTRTSWYCPCTPVQDCPGVYLCNIASGRSCFNLHHRGEAPENRKAKAQTDVWRKRREAVEVEANGRGHRRVGRGKRAT